MPSAFRSMSFNFCSPVDALVFDDAGDEGDDNDGARETSSNPIGITPPLKDIRKLDAL